jgi:hypothetical protein
MFGKKSKEKKAENIEVESLHGFNVKELKNAKQISQENSFKRNLKEKAERIEAQEKNRQEILKKETEKLEADEKKKTDYLNEKSKLTTEELLAQILVKYEENQSLEKATTKETKDNIEKMVAMQRDMVSELTKINFILELMNRNVDTGLGMPSIDNMMRDHERSKSK